MDQENWKFVLDYLSAKENAHGNVQQIKQEEKKIQEWLSKDPKNQQDLEHALWLWQISAVPHEDDDWKESFNTIQTSLSKEVSPKTVKFRFWIAAAAVFTAVALSTFFYRLQQPVLQNTGIDWVTKSAGAGKVINIILPDSTEIWLNSGSSISFPKNLQHAALRTVKLKGEAFFKVKRDPRHPFVVHSLNLRTQVLGTSFNIRAWEGHRSEVTVLTGKVAVSRDSAGGQSAAIHLLPNQKAAYDVHSTNLSLENIGNAQTAADWTEGKMTFDQTDLRDVFEVIERKYDMKIITDQSFKGCKLTAQFDNVNLNEVLKTIQLSLDLHYTINKKTIYIKGGKCN